MKKKRNHSREEKNSQEKKTPARVIFSQVEIKLLMFFLLHIHEEEKILRRHEKNSRN